MAITTQELDKWIKANWPKKFDRKLGEGDPRDTGFQGTGVFDFYQDVLTGELYAWTVNLDTYLSDPNYIGTVPNETVLQDLYPIAPGKFFIVTTGFKFQGINFRDGSKITSSGTITSNAQLKENITLESADRNWHPITSDAADVLYTNTNPTPVTIGGIEAGTTFVNESLQSVFDRLLYPYQYPSFTDFSISNIAGVFEAGSVRPASTENASWTEINESNILPDSYIIQDVSNNTELASGTLSSPVPINIPELSFAGPGTHTFRISATNTENDTFFRNLNIYWRWAFYYGESTDSTITESGIKSLRVKELDSSFSGTYSFLSGGYKYFAWPLEFGQASRFKDQATNLDVAMDDVSIVSVTNDNGSITDYYVYRTLNVLGGEITIIVS